MIVILINTRVCIYSLGFKSQNSYVVLVRNGACFIIRVIIYLITCLFQFLARQNSCDF